MPDLIKDRAFLSGIIRQRKTVLTVGLDSDITKLPSSLGTDVLSFNKSIIDATRDLCVAYKPNFAFYESMGTAGWTILEETVKYIGDQHLIIADAKRGDIGNTSTLYAKAVFDAMGCDAITIHPYMGKDSITPFLQPGKWVIVLALTSNEGSHDFQKKELANGMMVYEEVMHTVASWSDPNHMMFVLGATHPAEIASCRGNFPDHFFLIPGVGAQGGDLEAICAAGLNADGGLLINASRSILYASHGDDYAQRARGEAEKLNAIIRPHLMKALG